MSTTTVKEGIRANLVSLIEKRGCTKRELASALGVSSQSVTNWTSGASSIDIERIPSICDFFDVTVSEFFSQAEEHEPPTRLTRDEREVVELLRILPEDGRHAVLAGLRDFALSQPYKARQ